MTNPTGDLTALSGPSPDSSSPPGADWDDDDDTTRPSITYGRLPVVVELGERIIATARLQRFLLDHGDALRGEVSLIPGASGVEVLCDDTAAFADAWHLFGQHAPMSALRPWTTQLYEMVTWDFYEGVALTIIAARERRPEDAS